MADNAVALDGVAGIRPPLWIPMNSPDGISDGSCEALPASYPLSIPSPVASPGRAPTKRPTYGVRNEGSFHEHGG